MRRSLQLFFLLGLLTATGLAAQERDARAQVEAFMRAWHDAVESRDVDYLRSHYAADAYRRGNDGAEAFGAEDVAAMYAAPPVEPFGPYDIRSIWIAPDERVAVVDARVDRTGLGAELRYGPFFMVLVYDGERWLTSRALNFPGYD